MCLIKAWWRLGTVVNSREIWIHRHCNDTGLAWDFMHQVFKIFGFATRNWLHEEEGGGGGVHGVVSCIYIVGGGGRIIAI